jgi:hypothetical protein
VKGYFSNLRRSARKQKAQKEILVKLENQKFGFRIRRLKPPLNKGF